VLNQPAERDRMISAFSAETFDGLGGRSLDGRSDTAAESVLTGRQNAAMVRMVFIQKCDPEQAFWGWAEIASLHALPFMPVRDLLTVDRVKVSESYARRVLAYLRDELQMAEDDTPNIRCPAEVLDENGRPVALA
jgi:hypothetical protein